MRAFILFALPFVFTGTCDPAPAPNDEPEIPCAEIWTDGHTPELIETYTWEGETVWVADFGCCDMFVEVYDATCTYLCAPEGGLTGAGDGRCPTFFDEARFVEQAWPIE